MIVSVNYLQVTPYSSDGVTEEFTSMDEAELFVALNFTSARDYFMYVTEEEADDPAFPWTYLEDIYAA